MSLYSIKYKDQDFRSWGMSEEDAKAKFLKLWDVDINELIFQKIK